MGMNGAWILGEGYSHTWADILHAEEQNWRWEGKR